MTPPSNSQASDVLERLRKASAEATPGPWEVDETEEDLFVMRGDASAWICRDMDEVADAALIALARNHLDALLDVAEAAREMSNHAPTCICRLCRPLARLSEREGVEEEQ
jgi:hypothetical protein